MPAMAPPDKPDVLLSVEELEDVGEDASSGVAIDEILAILLEEDWLVEAVEKAT
jgi:hypothetical protein